MRFIVMVRATKDSESGAQPDPKVFEAMVKFNDELARAGVLVSAEGLHPSSDGARLKFCGPIRTVIDGPFTETKELIAGFWMWQVKSREEAIAWLKRCPHPFPGQDAEIELRQVFELEEFTEIAPEIRDREHQLRTQLEARAQNAKKAS